MNAIAPALIEGGATLPGAEDEAGRRALAKHLPIQRLGRTEEMAEAVLALVTNPFITAQTLSVDGGMYPR